MLEGQRQKTTLQPPELVAWGNFRFFITPRPMYRAFTGALALALALLVLHWLLPELAQELVEVLLKVLQLITAALDLVLQKLPTS